MSTPLAVLVGFLAFFFSSFLFWRRLREDYPPGRIFSFILALFFMVLLASFVAGRLPANQVVLAALSFWLPFFLLSLMTLYLVKKLDFRLFEVLDSLVPAWLFFMLIYSLPFAVNFDMSSLPGAGLALLGIIVYRLLRSRYRRFSWYPSGKVGFLGLVTLALYFFVRFLIAILFPLDLASAIMSLVLSFFFLFAVYLRSGRANAERILLKWSNLHFLSIWKK